MQLQLSTEFASILNGKNVYCGFSGGADSLTLLLLLSEAREAFHFSLNAVHFEHGLRGRAGVEDSLFCQDFCKSNDIPFTCISLNVPDHIKTGEGIEAAARRLRMDYWKKLPENSIVALGHNADDLTENLFLRLMRGSNVSALTSLSEYNETERVAIIRPLLRYRRSGIEQFLKGRGLQWRTDATNLESDYGRNFLRNIILPELYAKFPYGKDGISRSLRNLQFDAEFIDNYAATYYQSMNPELRNSWLNLPQAVFCRIFRLFLNEKTGRNIIVGHKLLRRFESMINNPPGQGFSQLIITDYPDFSLYIDSISVFFVDLRKKEPVFWDLFKDESVNFSNYTLKVSVNPVGKGDGIKNAVFDSVSLKMPFIIREAQPGDKMTAFGRKSPESVNKYLSEANIPAPFRKSYPVLCNADGEIIWIPGVKRSGKYPARDSNFLMISCEKF